VVVVFGIALDESGGTHVIVHVEEAHPLLHVRVHFFLQTVLAPTSLLLLHALREPFLI